MDPLPPLPPLGWDVVAGHWLTWPPALPLGERLVAELMLPARSAARLSSVVVGCDRLARGPSIFAITSALVILFA